MVSQNTAPLYAKRQRHSLVPKSFIILPLDIKSVQIRKVKALKGLGAERNNLRSLVVIAAARGSRRNNRIW
jgi:hypothetical protein